MDIIATVLLLILAGYENTANTMCIVAYNLAMYPEIQARLYEEIQQHVDDKVAVVTLKSFSPSIQVILYFREKLATKV